MTSTDKVIKILAAFACFVAAFPSTAGWRNDRRPKFFGDKVPVKLLDPVHHSTQRKIVTYHNFFRSRVHPPATDMLAMTWHSSAAKDAQKWADQCQFLIHDNVTGRWVDDFGSCGQNIFVSTHQVPWMFAIKTWFLEKHNFTYGSPKNNLFEVGHYTQMVWAASHKVGCGFTKCPLKVEKRRHGGTGTESSSRTHSSSSRSSSRTSSSRSSSTSSSSSTSTSSRSTSLSSTSSRHSKRTHRHVKHPKYFYNYVCNYCPIGNYMERLGRPYKKGPSCARCKGNCKLRKLCTNSCQYADLWVNCRELNATWNQWLCHTKTKEGLERQKHCRATCECSGKIYTQLGRIKV